MEKYEYIKVVGEGSYGKVLKCRHRETGQMVAIKKFLETEEDQTSRKIALREIRMLRKLSHENLVSLIEVFRRKKRFYMVFEYMNHTLLDELEIGGLDHTRARRHSFQIIRAINFCHENNIVHRDVKPENVLVSSKGVVKLCDFGFARFISGEPCTDYVATRWYRAPELLVGDNKYGKPVDIWAMGCLFTEMLTSEPLFPGESDIDQLFKIKHLLGNLTSRQVQIAIKTFHIKSSEDLYRSLEDGMDCVATPAALQHKIKEKFPSFPKLAVDFAAACLMMEPAERATSSMLLKHEYFTHDKFSDTFLPELLEIIQEENLANPLLQAKHSSISHQRTHKGPRKPNQLSVATWKLSLGSGSNQNKGKLQDESERTESNSTPYPSIFRNREWDGLDYRRDILPHAQTLKPYNVRHVAKSDQGNPRTSLDDFSLPQLPGGNLSLRLFSPLEDFTSLPPLTPSKPSPHQSPH